MVVRSEAAGVVRTGERGGNRAVDMDVLERECGSLSLLYAARRKRCVFLPLVAAFDIPSGFSVAKKNDTDHERVSFLGVQGSGFRVVVAASPRIYMGRCPKVAFQSLVTSH